MEKVVETIAKSVITAVLFLSVYTIYLCFMTSHWYSFEKYTGQFFKQKLKDCPTLTIQKVSGGYLSVVRKVLLSNGQTIIFIRPNNPSAWDLEVGQKIAVYILASELSKNKTSYQCCSYEMR